MKRNQTSNSFLEEISAGIDNYSKSLAEMDSNISSEKSNLELLKKKLDNYSDLDDEAGFLKLKANIRTSEDRLDFLQLKRKAFTAKESDLEADRAKFRQAQSIIINSGLDRVTKIMSELTDIKKNLDIELDNLDRLVDAWCSVYGQQRPIKMKYLGDPSGMLSLMNSNVVTYQTKVSMLQKYYN